MKLKFTAIFILTLAFASFVNAQSKSANLGKINAETQKQVAASLTAYYALSNALINSDTEKASVEADVLLQTLAKIDAAKMNEAQKTLWTTLEKNLSKDARHINKNKDLEHQREHFMTLSNNMYSLVFNFKANETDAYLQYCPMKKASWLSDKKEVRNPYYGNKMLDCGSVKQTLKKN